MQGRYCRIGERASLVATNSRRMSTFNCIIYMERYSMVLCALNALWSWQVAA